MSLDVESVSLSRGGEWLLAEVDLVLRPGEVISVIGPNGAGKTSLMRVAAGELEPDEGGVLLDDMSISDLGAESLARRRAVLPQRSLLEFPFRAADVIEMGRIPHFTGRRKDEEVVREVMDAVGLTALAERVYTTLSGGERQRVQIARVLAQVWDRLEGSYLLFDEPTAPLDLAHQLGFLDLVHNMRDLGAGILLVMHDLNLAARFSDRIVLLSGGRVVASGLAGDVLTKENIGNAFGVDVDITIVDGHPFIHAHRVAS